MRSLFPPIEPYHTFEFPVSDIHTLYVEESGNPNGIPVVFLHGGPGIGASPRDRCYFDPTRYRIIIFDQRGCGRSKPHACLLENTTEDLIEDMEKIRRKLNVDSWILFGGSWGSTLSLAYAVKYPDCVKDMVLRGIFYACKKELEWFYCGKNGACEFFPEYYEDFLAPLKKYHKQGNNIHDYYSLLTHEDENIQLEAAKAWSLWEGRTVSLLPNQDILALFSDPYRALSIARIECHYFIHEGFFDPPLYEQLAPLHDIPTYIVHGRYDIICPPANAYFLKKMIPNAQLTFVDAAGHAARESGIQEVLLTAMEEIIARF